MTIADAVAWYDAQKAAFDAMTPDKKRVAFKVAHGVKAGVVMFASSMAGGLSARQAFMVMLAGIMSDQSALAHQLPRKKLTDAERKKLKGGVE